MLNRRNQRRRLSKDEIQQKTVLTFRRLQVIQDLGQRALFWGGLALVTYLGVYLPVKESAGKDTTISVLYNFVANVKMSVGLAWGAGASFGYGWWRERRKRLKERSEKDERIEVLEKAIDPNRSSSGLTPGGQEQATITGP